MKKKIIQKLSILMAISFVFIFVQTFACVDNNKMKNIENNKELKIEEIKKIASSIKVRGYDDDVIYDYTTTMRQSKPYFSNEIRGYEIIRNGLRYRGTLYFQYSGGNPGDYYGVYKGDLYFAGRV